MAEPWIEPNSVKTFQPARSAGKENRIARLIVECLAILVGGSRQELEVGVEAAIERAP